MHDSAAPDLEPTKAIDGSAASCPLGPALPPGFPAPLAFWIRTPCGRAKYQALVARPGVLARLRLGWFVLIASLRDLGQRLPQSEGEGGGGWPAD